MPKSDIPFTYSIRGILKMVREFTTEFGGKKMAELSSILLMLFPILLSSCTGDEIEKEVNFQKDHEDLNEAHSSKVEEEAQARADTVEENAKDAFSEEILKEKELESFSEDTTLYENLNTSVNTEDTTVLKNLNVSTSSEEHNETNKNEQKTNNTNENSKLSKWDCRLLSLFGPEEKSKVIILKNDTELADILSKSNEGRSCFLLYFFVKWCKFCAEFSVEVNAIGRSYYGLPVIAVDAYALSSIAGKFGITGVPTLILFFSGRPVAKFNRRRELLMVDKFITSSTGLTANETLDILSEDGYGPIPTKIEEQGDIYLILSVVAIAVIFIINLCLTEPVIGVLSSSVSRFKAWALHQKTD